MFAMVPDGTECVMLDAGYDVIRNYKMIRDAGRKPMICTRKNHVARGLRVVGADFSSVAPRSRGGSVHPRSRQAGGKHGSDRRGWRASGHGSGSGDVLKSYRGITYKSSRACLWQSSHTPIAYPLALCPTSICELKSVLSI